MQSTTLLSPAKVNLRLEILFKRPDGYHEIATLFHKISIFDKIRLTSTPGNKIVLTTSNPQIPSDHRNLAWQAADLILKTAGISQGIQIDIRKHIPAGAGLGGGSSNAATTLRGLNSLLKLNFSEKTLHSLALDLGADVPFFLMDAPTAYGTGIGETLTPVKHCDKLWFLVIFPGVTVSTAWAYQTFAKYNLLTKSSNNNIINNYNLDRNTVKSLLYNDFESVVNSRHPEIDIAKNLLYKTGAEAAMLSGSGSAVFGIYPDEQSAVKAFSAIQTGPEQKMFLAHSLTAESKS